VKALELLHERPTQPRLERVVVPVLTEVCQLLRDTPHRFRIVLVGELGDLHVENLDLTAQLSRASDRQDAGLARAAGERLRYALDLLEAIARIVGWLLDIGCSGETRLRQQTRHLRVVP
jgi:hypothetical protein